MSESFAFNPSLLMNENALHFGELPTTIDVELHFGPLDAIEVELVRDIGSPALTFNDTEEFALEPIVQTIKTLGILWIAA
jgi:hypothetical protein